MQTWLALARGPFFWAAMTFMVLGLARHVIVSVVDIGAANRRAGDPRMPYRKIAKVTLAWLIPLSRLGQNTFAGATSVAFHVSIILVPVFLAEHIALWRSALGVSWPALPGTLADVLTVIAVVTALVLVGQRTARKAKRSVSRFQDYFLPLFIALPFASGFLVTHPAWNAFPYDATLLVHVMSADVLLILMPTTKLNHAALMPEAHLITEASWHWPADAGKQVGIALGKEGEPV